MSGHADPVQAEAKKQTAVFLEKTIDVDQLLRLIARVLAERRALPTTPKNRGRRRQWR